jgi:hypothetical protein
MTSRRAGGLEQLRADLKLATSVGICIVERASHFYVSSPFEGKVPSAFAYPVGEVSSDAQCTLIAVCLPRCP